MAINDYGDVEVDIIIVKDRLARSCEILHNLSLEYRHVSWWQRMLGKRWVISDEPLRHDAARFLRSIRHDKTVPEDYKMAGE